MQPFHSGWRQSGKMNANTFQGSTKISKIVTKWRQFRLEEKAWFGISNCVYQLGKSSDKDNSMNDLLSYTVRGHVQLYYGVNQVFLPVTSSTSLYLETLKGTLSGWLRNAWLPTLSKTWFQRAKRFHIALSLRSFGYMGHFEFGNSSSMCRDNQGPRNCPRWNFLRYVTIKIHSPGRKLRNIRDLM